MPCVIRKNLGDRYENFAELAPGEWRLEPQIEVLHTWLRAHRGDLDPAFEWVADIGFCVRPDALGGGPAISRELMRLCLEANLEVILSEYQGEA